VKQNTFVKNISILVIGTFTAQLIPVAMQPVLKRLFSPEEFGVFDIYLKTLGILFVFFSLKYEMGIVLPKNRIKAIILLNISILSSLGFTLLTYLLIILLGDQIIVWIGISPNYKFALYFLPLSTLFFTIFTTINYLLIRDKKFFASSMNKVTRRSSEAFVQTGAAFVPILKGLGLFLGDFIGSLFCSVTAWYRGFGSFKIDRRFFNFRLMKHIAKEYIELPKFNILPELLNTLFFAAISFLILAKFSIIEVGYLELTQRILAIPTAFISFSVGQVLLQKLTESVNNKKPIMKDLNYVFMLLLVLTVPFILLVVFFAPPVFSYVFGNEWTISGFYSQYLVFFYALGFLVSPLGQVLISLKKFKANALWKMGRFVVIIPLFFIEMDSILTYLIYFSALGSASYIVYFAIIYYHANKFDKSLKNL
jgi:O-antigen/teichoic acid export membrane protein